MASWLFIRFAFHSPTGSKLRSRKSVFVSGCFSPARPVLRFRNMLDSRDPELPKETSYWGPIHTRGLERFGVGRFVSKNGVTS
jgi:hypothetical protein